MNDLQIDNEFQSLIPPLSPEEYAALESNLLDEGCRDALVVWGDILVDGHNRYRICKVHGIPFQTINREFENRQGAIEWIIRNQFGRRNLPAYERARLALKLKPLIAARAKEHQGERTDICQKSDRSAIDTKRELAKAAGVSHDTIAKVEKIEAMATPEDKEDLRSGEASINQVYQRLKRQERKQVTREEDERIEASMKSAQALIDTVKRQKGVELGEPVTDLQIYRVAKKDAEYYRSIGDNQQYDLLYAVFKAIKKLPDDTSLYEAMWRGSIDPMADVRELRQAIERLNRIMTIFVKKGDKDIDEVFDEMLKDDESPD